MTTVNKSDSQRIHDRLDHPVVDADGHVLEYMPVVLDYLDRFGGPKAVDHYTKVAAWYTATAEQRLDKRMVRPPWWALPTVHGIDHATSILPALLEERMGEMGLDFTVLYPSVGLAATHIEDPDLRRTVCRAFNTFQADLFGPHSAHMTPAAAIPMHTPEEAIDELDYAIGELGMKATMMAGHVRRRLAGIDTSSPHATWIDNLAVDSLYDYDPVWDRCQELRVAPAFHSGSMGWGSRVSVNNYMYNHIGHFAAASEALCKGLFFGGVTKRFPQVRFMFLEAGVGWAVNLFADLVGHWEKRNSRSIANYDPANLDTDLVGELFDRYAPPMLAKRRDQLGDMMRVFGPEQPDRSRLDDFASAGISEAEDIVARFVPNFFFGCEADDRMNAWAFNTTVNPFGAKLHAVFSSDIGHWDVPDMREVLEEAWELVEHDMIGTEDFKEFVFTNPVKLLAGMNPEFFKGTSVESAVGEALNNV